MADKTIRWLDNWRAVREQPFFIYWAPGAVHAPIHVPESWRDRYKGQFDDGWGAYREKTFARQKDMGILTKDANLAPPPRPDSVPDWDSYSKEEKQFLARQMEITAAFMEHTDYQARRIIDHLEQMGILDTTSLFCGKDGWCHLTAVIDRFDREIVGWRLSGSGKAQIAASALEDGLRRRSFWLGKKHLTLRSDNGLVFGAKAFVNVVNRYGVEQEYITPYSPEQNEMIERFFRRLKEECIWLNRFQSRDEAFRKLADWIDFYNNERVHSALGYKAPKEYRLALVA
jgi:transposase InsO family protein